jgi:hypothetical protein
MGVTEEAGKALSSTVEAMKSSPLAIALLFVNIGFLIFVGYVLHVIGTISIDRSKTQNELVMQLVSALAECKATAKALNLDDLLLGIQVGSNDIMRGPLP